MNIYFIIFVILIILLISITKWNVKRKIGISLLFFIISSIIYLFLLKSLWSSSSHHNQTLQTQEFLEAHLKKIKLINENTETIDISINFEYSPQEIKDKNLDITNYYNKKFVVRLEPASEFTVTSPISIGKDLKFPDNFSITLKNLILKSSSKTVLLYLILMKTKKNTRHQNGF